MTTDPFTQTDFLEFAERVRTEMLPKLSDSAITISLAPGADVDVKYAVELGFSIMLDKPIIIVAMPGRPVPAKLRKLADAVIEADITTEAGQALLQEAMVAVFEQLDAEKKWKSRADHLAWAKERALDHLPDWNEAMASFQSDLGKHKGTAGHQVIELMTMEAIAGRLNEYECRGLIEGSR
jgi:hypothetical protein